MYGLLLAEPLFPLSQKKYDFENRGLVYTCPWIKCEVHQEILKIFSWWWIEVVKELLNTLQHRA
jgi:hypothetical protein